MPVCMPVCMPVTMPVCMPVTMPVTVPVTVPVALLSRTVVVVGVRVFPGRLVAVRVRVVVLVLCHLVTLSVPRSDSGGATGTRAEASSTAPST
jgi:hypothetical protein